MPACMTCDQVLNTVCFYARTHAIDRVIPLDEFDAEAAALIREHMRLPGHGQTQMRLFRDKLSMRTEAKKHGVRVPEFTGVFHHAEIAAYMREVPGPWLLKPRMNASAIGIKPIQHAEELWPVLEQLGDLASHYVLERFVAGEVYHVEGISWQGELLFEQPFKYGKPPMQTMHHGGVFTTRALDLESDEARGLHAIHGRLLEALGMRDGVTHTEFIRSAADGQFYFLETAARVGGAYIADTLEYATNVNTWVEWARIEYALATGQPYALPALRRDYAGSVISLARQERPDTRDYQAPEIVRRLEKPHHAGLLLASPSAERLRKLLDEYGQRFLEDFCAVIPPPERPTS
jgi:biotin carboxylase